MNRMRKLMIVLVLCVAAMVRPAHATSCPPFSEQIVLAGLSATEIALKLFQQAIMRALAMQMEQFTKLEISATKIVASQVATAAKAQINASVVLKQGEMAAIANLETTKRMAEVVADYSLATGQGTNPCEQLSAQNRLAIAGGQTAAIAETMLSGVDNGPGKYGNAESYVRRATDTRRKYFSTPDEQALGYGPAATAKIRGLDGREVSLAGADTNASILFIDSTDSRVTMAKSAFLNNIAGVPDLPITPDVASTPEGRRYMAEKQRKDALMSVAMNSLATVGAENSPNAELGMSEMEAMRRVVAMYYGSSQEARKRWQGWSAQSQRGLMVDGLKIEAAQLQFLQKLYQQGQRVEALLGTQVALEAGREYNRLAGTAGALQANKVPIR